MRRCLTPRVVPSFTGGGGQPLLVHGNDAEALCGKDSRNRACLKRPADFSVPLTCRLTLLRYDRFKRCVGGKLHPLCAVAFSGDQDYWAPNGSNVHYSRENIDVRVSTCTAFRNLVL